MDKYTKYLTEYKINKVKDVKGVTEEIVIGDKVVKGTTLNLLHWIVLS